MGREVRRVPLSFNWPLEVVWGGYLNPYDRCNVECQACRGSGLGPEMRQLQDDWYDLANTGRKWSDKLTQDEVDALVEYNRLRIFDSKSNKWVSVPRTAEEVNKLSGLHHDAINMSICLETRAKRLGIYKMCDKCGGEGVIWTSAEDKAKYESGKASDPPVGEGWQLWETVSEGSPITPVFATSEELIDYMTKPGPAGRRKPWATGYSREEAEALVKDGWCPSFTATKGKVYNGAEGMVAADKK